jgi:lysophospholipase L1-like esterase
VSATDGSLTADPKVAVSGKDSKSGYFGDWLYWSSTGPYAAIGDSFASGTGAVGPKVKQKNAYDNACFRTPGAYPRLVKSGAHLVDKSCSGAKIGSPSAKVTDDKSAYGQVKGLPVDASLVTVTIGGNDLDWSTIVQSCADRLDNQTKCEHKWGPEVESRVARLPDRLTDLYLAIHQRAPDARVLVVDYPDALPNDLPRSCLDIPSNDIEINGLKIPTSHFLKIVRDDMPFFRRIGSELNTAVAAGVNRATIPGEFVPQLVSVKAKFAGHSLCSDDSYLWPIRVPPWPFASSLHPNIAGNKAMAAAIDERLDKADAGW